MTYRVRVFTLTLVGIAVVALAWVYYTYPPAEYSFYPRCPFFVATGLKCPGCGSQRAISSILHGEIVQALHYNAALVLGSPFIVLLLRAEYLRKHRPELYLRYNSKLSVAMTSIIVIAWGIARNIWGW